MAKGFSQERIKLVVVIALSLVAAVMAYFRFVRQPRPPASVPAAADAAPAAYDVPELADWLAAAASSARDARPLPYMPPARDLFAPVTDRQRDGGGGRSGVAHLSAVISGKDGTLAVINNQVLGVGDMLGAYTIIEIGPERAVLQDGDKQLILQVGE